MRAHALGIALLLVGTISCTSSQPTPAPTVVKRVPVKDEEGNELTEPEKVRSKQVRIDNGGVKTVTIGNINGDYALGCT